MGHSEMTARKPHTMLSVGVLWADQAEQVNMLRVSGAFGNDSRMAVS